MRRACTEEVYTLHTFIIIIIIIIVIECSVFTLNLYSISLSTQYLRNIFWCFTVLSRNCGGGDIRLIIREGRVDHRGPPEVKSIAMLTENILS